MERRTLLAVGLAAIMLMPVAAAYAPSGNSAPAQGEPASDAVSPSESSDGNYTRLYIEQSYRGSEIKPGESATYNITVGNSEDHAVELDPHVVQPRVQGRPLQQDWVTIEDADTELSAGEERTFTVTVSIPEDTELGSYRTLIAFTDQTATYRPGQPALPVHAATLSVDVFEEPTVEVLEDRYYSTQVQAGDSYTYEFTIRNTGEESVPVNPKLQTDDARRYPGEANTVDRSWFDIDAPNEVGAGENVTVEVTVTPPETAHVGRYGAQIDMGLSDPARPDRGDYWQQVDVDFRVWTQPEEPFETSVQVSDDTRNMTLTLSSSQYGAMADNEPASFDVTFVAPDGSTVDPERVEVRNSGGVNLGREGPRGQSQGPYVSEGGDKEFVYRVDDPEAGEWTVQILPDNTIDFHYDITRNEA
jgi:hypothetical protein